jgi:hypothetical protein
MLDDSFDRGSEDVSGCPRRKAGKIDEVPAN